MILFADTISIHAPPRGATILSFFDMGGEEDFNSRPSARGDLRRKSQASPFRISIHAPPRGATHGLHASDSALCISIHAPPRGATRDSWGNQRKQDVISIHAPPRGATQTGEIRRQPKRYFNSRPSARGDGREHGLFIEMKHFNSRPSARGDLTTKHMAHRRKYFNSRPSARGDGKGRITRLTRTYFNSRPSARGD